MVLDGFGILVTEECLSVSDIRIAVSVYVFI
jgi:hypothetical protein